MMLTDSFLASHPLVVVPGEIHDREEMAGSWSTAAEADVTERLKQLGYLG